MTENEKILAALLQNVHSWTELKPKLSEYNTSTTDTTTKTTRAGKLFEYFTKLCFLHDTEFSEEYNCKDIYLYDEIPTDLRQRLNLPLVEHGIDLLIVDHDEQIIAVQCKFKNDETVKLNWNADKLGNFFGFARNANLHCIFSNSSDITQVAQNLTDNFKFFSYSHLQNISAATFEKMRTALIGEPIKEINKKKPHYYQKKAIVAVVSHFNNNNERGQLILPCGAGKTLVALWIKERLQAKNTLVLVPSLALLRQIKASWNEAYNTKFIRLNVCSEKDIDSDIDNDIAITHTYEIIGNVTSDKIDVANFLQRPDNKVVFSTYQSLQVVVDALQLIPDFHFDLIIADEAHKTAGFEDQNKFTLVHNKDKVRGLKRLYMTATPRIASDELVAVAKKTERIKFLKDMSNPKEFGKEAYRMTFGTAIDKKILVKYKIIAVGVSDYDLKTYIEKNIQLSKSESITEYAHNYALNIVMEKYKAFHALTFHSRIHLAESFTKRHNRLIPNVISASISGKQTTSEREIILKAFEKADKAVVSNAKCLTEGVDVPVIDVVYYSDPRNSKIDIVQSAGRALRKSKHGNKEWGFIVVPIFHKDRETVEEAIEKSDYKNLITVIRSLCDQDERLVTEITELAYNKDRKKSNGTFELTFSDEQTDTIIQFEQIKEKLKNSLFNQVIETLKDSWEIHYKEVEEYFNLHGHCNLKARYKTKDGFGLGTWCVSQRVNYNKGLLADTEIKKLQKINFDFDPDRTLFENDFKKLLQYKEINGHVNVPTVGTNLGRRVNRLRLYYRKGILSPEKIERLISIGFQFTFNDNKSWDERFEDLKLYYKNNNTKNVLSNIDLSLYFWEKRLRASKNKLTQIQIQKLTEIQFDWEFEINRETWDEKYKILKSYFDLNNTSRVPSTDPLYKKLRHFIHNNNSKYRESKLDVEKLKLLNDIKFDFLGNTENELKELDWNKNYEVFKRLFLETGNLNLEKSSENDNLLKWAKKQRRQKVKQVLSAEKITLLNEIGFPWVGWVSANKSNKKFKISNEEKWNMNYEKLKNHFEINNTCLLPFETEYNPLRSWIVIQRKNYKRGKLSETQFELLNNINFPWNVKRGAVRKTPKVIKISNEEEWNKMYQNLVEFTSNAKTFKIPTTSDFNALRSWCMVQRNRNNNGKLLEHRLNKLNEIGFPWVLKRGKTKTKETFVKVLKDEYWEAMFQKLQSFYEENNHFYIPDSEENSKLIGWVNTQIIYRRRGKITPYRLSKLNSINFTFSKAKSPNDRKGIPKALTAQQEMQWLKMFEKLHLFVTENGHSSIPRSTKENERLSHWLILQRKNYRENKLPDEKAEKLKAINVDLSYNKAVVYDNIWMKRYNQLAEYFNQRGHSNVSGRDKENKSLGQWVLVQRREMKKSELEPFKIELLEKLNFSWSLENKGFPQDDKAWDIKYNLLLQFKNQFLTTVVPQSNKEIGRWVNDQRVKFKRGKLSQSKIDKLNKIGFVWVAKK